jgi:hypothetical protein
MIENTDKIEKIVFDEKEKLNCVILWSIDES